MVKSGMHDKHFASWSFASIFHEAEREESGRV